LTAHRVPVPSSRRLVLQLSLPASNVGTSAGGVQRGTA
jgi:hypothetical protein